MTLEQYPDIAPPTINISTNYNGASAETVENSVTQMIEQELTGLDGLMYFSSSSSSNGRARISVTFEQGTDPDTAQIQVQNRVQQAINRLPDSVQDNGVRVNKGQSDFLMLVAVSDETDKSTNFDVADYLASNIEDSISRIEGVGSVEVFGSRYAMRIWLDPNALRSYNLMPSDVAEAIQTQNVQVSAGSIGGLPNDGNQRLTATVTAQSMMQTPEEFRNIIIKHATDGSLVRISDVATVEIGSEGYNITSNKDGHPAAGLGINLASGANALATADAVKAMMRSYEPVLPEGYTVSFNNDASVFIKYSVQEVVKTLFEAIILVVIVMFLFLGNWRTTIIPALTVPVVLLGTFAVLAVMGYTINTLTLFAMVLAIGLLVDDTIVVVENVERLMRDRHLNPKDATVESMHEVTSSLVGIAMVLSVVFLPMAFFSGATGVIYRQFSVTIISAMVLSVVVAVTLAPALCGMVLKEHKKDKAPSLLERIYDKLLGNYAKGTSGFIKRPLRFLAVYLALSVAAFYVYTHLPTGFLPNEDQGGVMVRYSLPEGADRERTILVANEVRDYFLRAEPNNVASVFTGVGFNFGEQGQNVGMAFVDLKPWEERVGQQNSAFAIANRASGAFRSIRDANVYSLVPPSIRGLGQSEGYEFKLQADAATSRARLLELRESFLAAAAESKLLANTRSANSMETNDLRVSFNRELAMAYGIRLQDIYSTINAAWAGDYINDFMDRSRIKRVFIQSKAEFRSKPEDLQFWTVRNSKGEMVPLSEVSATVMTKAPGSLLRYNGLASYNMEGNAPDGVSSGEAMDEIVRIAGELGAKFAWSGLSYQEQQSTGQALYLYILSVLVIFLCLAALYESWSIPFCVLLILPLGILGAVLATHFRELDNNVYFQVALLTTIGLSAKNAIMMITFMEAAVKRGLSLFDAAVEGAELRLRPILMTSLAFVAGVVPLAISTGVGANSRVAIGTGIVGGTLSATALAIFFVPLFFLLINKLTRRKTGLPETKETKNA
jgi:multidrug efflux pump